jgi:hypothetical protein
MKYAYTVAALESLQQLPQTTQGQIEWLRANHLPQLAPTGNANEGANCPVEHRVSVSLHDAALTLHY